MDVLALPVGEHLLEPPGAHGLDRFHDVAALGSEGHHLGSAVVGIDVLGEQPMLDEVAHLSADGGHVAVDQVGDVGHPLGASCEDEEHGVAAVSTAGWGRGASAAGGEEQLVDTDQCHEQLVRGLFGDGHEPPPFRTLGILA